MNEYYAVVRSTDHLAHYGVKGMQWGVRKAIERGNFKALSRQYKKAQKKLAKLNAAANVEIQKGIANKHNKRAKTALKVGLAGLGVFTGNEFLVRHLAKKHGSLSTPVTNHPAVNELVEKSARKKRYADGGKGIYKVGEGLGTGPVGQTTNGLAQALNPSVAGSPKPNPLRTMNRISSTVGMAGFGTAAYQKGRAIAAKYRTTSKGHAKAVAKRNAFKREMDKAFAGTEFGNRSHKSKRFKRTR